jgi:hypothetical protein
MSRIFAAAGITETLLRGVSLVTGERSFSTVMLLTLFTMLSTILVGVAMMIIESFTSPPVLSLDDDVVQESMRSVGIGVNEQNLAIPEQR